jgi:3',5'-cyclic AMP phosphodiesterase CpdA
MPFYNCMGNHDALGWSARRKCAADDPDIGKKMIMERLEWPKSYYSFDHGGWHSRIGKEQLEWLAHDLGAAKDRPKVCMTHIAAFCNVGQMTGDKNAKAMNGSMTVWDTRELREVLERHNVKALLQGHSHRIEEYRFNGVWYLTSAAVSGAWWAGDWVGAPPGYTEFRCRGDELTWTHRTFDWAAQLEPDDELERTKIGEQEAQRAEQRRMRAIERGESAD